MHPATTRCSIALALLGFLAMQKPVAVSDRLDEPWWKARHEHCQRMTTYGRADVAFLGDSITQGWEGAGEPVWDTEIAPLKCANFGFGGDRTDHVMWRLENGELIAMHPKVVVLLIGTNDIGQDRSPEQAAEGVKTIVSTLRTELPRSQILLLGLLPRARNSSDPLRLGVTQATDLFKSVADGSRVRFLDIGASFLRPDRTLNSDLMPDFLHPNREGYELEARAIVPIIRDMLADS